MCILQAYRGKCTETSTRYTCTILAKIILNSPRRADVARQNLLHLKRGSVILREDYTL